MILGRVGRRLSLATVPFASLSAETILVERHTEKSCSWTLTNKKGSALRQSESNTVVNHED